MIFMAVVFIVIGAGCLFRAVDILSGTYWGVKGAIQLTQVNVVYLRGAVYLLASIVSVGLGVVLIGLHNLVPKKEEVLSRTQSNSK